MGFKGSKAHKIARLERERGFYHQGSHIRQAMFDSLILLDPQNEYHYRQKSVAHTKIGDFHIAFPLLEKAASIDPAEALYYYSWLLAYFYRDYERALQRLEEFDALTPNAPDIAWGEDVRYMKGLVYKQMGQYENAIEQFDLYERESTGSIDTYTYVYRGICWTKLRMPRKAIADFDLAIKDYSRCSMAYYYKGVALTKTGQKDNAKKAFQKARELVAKGYKKTDAYKEVYDEVYLEMIDDQLALLD
ncbi:MAG: tetratricopeptide repeat protein [Bacteroidota bacterium]